MTVDLVRLARGLRLPRTAVETDDDVLRSFLSLCPVDAVASDGTAGRVHGLWLPESARRRLDVIVHGAVDVPANHWASRRPELRMRRRRLRDDEIRVVRDIPVTSIERTWVDLAEWLSFPDLVAAGDSALRAGADPDALADAVRRARGQRGIKRARHALLYLDRRSRSRPESHLRCAVISDDLPRPAVNVPVFDALGQWLGEPDLSFEEVKLALEYNGADHAEVGRMRRDITRELDFDDRGRWRVMVFGPAEVFGRPESVCQIVRRVYAERRASSCRRAS
jgi:hypothetical protein